jgi:predicted amidophosphoribosyltransferase
MVAQSGFFAAMMLLGPIKRIYGAPASSVFFLIWFGLLWGQIICLWMGIALNRRRLRWANEGNCVACGYDLRATKERCPECGLEAGPRVRCYRCQREVYAFLPECPKCCLELKGEPVQTGA